MSITCFCRFVMAYKASNMNVIEALESFKTRKGTRSTKFANIGRSTYDKIQNFLKSGNVVLTHLDAPIGDYAKTVAYNKLFKEQYGFDLPEELLSFYETFDGFEIRMVKIEKADLRECVSEEEWKSFGNNLGEWALSYEEVLEKIEGTPWLNLVEAWKKGSGIPDELIAMLADYYCLPCDEENQIRRATNVNAKGIAFYGEAVCADSLQFEVDGSYRTIIPPLDVLFSTHNQGCQNHYYFDYCTEMYQVMLAVKHQKVELYQAQRGAGDLQKIKESLPIYLKKYLSSYPKETV